MVRTVNVTECSGGWLRTYTVHQLSGFIQVRLLYQTEAPPTPNHTSSTLAFTNADSRLVHAVRGSPFTYRAPGGESLCLLQCLQLMRAWTALKTDVEKTHEFYMHGERD